MPKVSALHREVRRRQILDAALVCFDRAGLQRTTTDDISAEAGVSAGSLYNYFPSKDDIIEAIAAERHAHELQLMQSAMRDVDPRVGIRVFIDQYFDWIADADERRRRRVNIEVWAAALHNPRLKKVVESGLAPIAPASTAIADAVLAGQLPPLADAESFVRAILALIQGFLLQQAWNPDVDIVAFKRTVVAMVDGMLAAALRSRTRGDTEPLQVGRAR